jgi:hypothetical protein
MIDNIESSISNIAVDTTGAAEELGTAHRYQKRAGRRAACLMIVVVFVVCIVLLAVSYSFGFTFVLPETVLMGAGLCLGAFMIRQDVLRGLYLPLRLIPNDVYLDLISNSVYSSRTCSEEEFIAATRATLTNVPRI